MVPRLLRRAVTRLASRRVPVWYHPDYRLPVTTLESRYGLEPRRADLVAWHLEQHGVVDVGELRTPTRISYRDLERVHAPAWLEALTRPETIAHVYGVDTWDVPVDQVMWTVRLACGGTLAAARCALKIEGPTLNLLGGFHHAERAHGAGLCPVNDVAVAVATLRGQGFDGQVAVLDLDAHPPDGTTDCLRDDPLVWIGSISGSDWELDDRVDETVIAGADDARYLEVLDGLLGRMPPSTELAVVLAGGDVLAGDRFGLLALTLEGALERDRRVARALRGTGSVWLPAGGYHAESWKVLAGTALVLARHPRPRVRGSADPLSHHFGQVFRSLAGPGFDQPEDWSAEEIVASIGGPHARRRFLGHYTAEGLEYALHAYGVLDQVRRLGYDRFRVDLGRAGTGDRLRLWGHAGGREHLLFEVVASRETVAGRPVLFVNWLTLRHPRGTFSDRRPRLPGQEVPGLGLAREAGELLARVAARLELDGVAFRPAWFHTAYAAGGAFAFADPEVQGRFRALVRDLGHLPLLELTQAVAEGRVRLDGSPWRWEPEDMVFWLDGFPEARAGVSEEKTPARFTLDERGAHAVAAGDRPA